MFGLEAMIHGMISIKHQIQSGTLNRESHTYGLMLIQLSDNLCTLLCQKYLFTILRNASPQHSFCGIPHSEPLWTDMVVDVPFSRLVSLFLLERLSSIFQGVNTLGFPCYELFVQTVG